MEKFNLLDEKITLEKAKNICTNISYYDFEKFTNEWYNNKNLSTALKVINTIFDKGYSVMDILDSYFQFVKITNILNEEAKYKSITIICSYISLFHTLHEDEI
jgi:DNA polymerase III gamma/tau subunit